MRTLHTTADTTPARSHKAPAAVALLLLAGVAALGHHVAPALPLPVWALGVGVLAGFGAGRARNAPLSLPYEYPLAVGLVLMGAQVHAGTIAAVGWSGLAAVAAWWVAITAAFLAAARLRLLPQRMAGLFALGLIGCGVTAVTAAAEADRRARGVPQMLASAAVLITGAIALLVFPVIGAQLQLQPERFGFFTGLTVANAAEATATAGLYADAALGVAAGLILLANALQGGPILGYLWLVGGRTESPLRSLLGRVPLFVWGFVAVAIAASLGAFTAAERESLSSLTRILLFVALVGVGYRTRLDLLRRVGLKPLAVAIFIWAVVTAAFGAVLLT